MDPASETAGLVEGTLTRLQDVPAHCRRRIVALNVLAGVAHAAAGTMSLVFSREVSIETFRVESTYNENVVGMFDVELVSAGTLRFDWLVAAYFLGTAAFHGLFVWLSMQEHRADYFLWRPMRVCFCWWRWLEYSVTASIQIWTIALSVGIVHDSI